MLREEVLPYIENKYGVELKRDEKQRKHFFGFPYYKMIDANEEIGYVLDCGTRFEIAKYKDETISIWCDDLYDATQLAYMLSCWLEGYSEKTIRVVLDRIDLIKKDSTTIALLNRLVIENSAHEKELRYSLSKIIRDNLNSNTFITEKEHAKKISAIKEVLDVIWIEPFIKD